MNLAGALIKHEQITTTLPKAKDLRPIVEKLVTLGKKGGLHARRQAIGFLRDPYIADKLFTTLGPRYAKRQRRLPARAEGGLPLRRRRPMAVIEFVERRQPPPRARTSGPSPSRPSSRTRPRVGVSEPKRRNARSSTGRFRLRYSLVNGVTFRQALASERDTAQRVLWTAFTPYVRDLGREITVHHYAFLAAAIARATSTWHSTVRRSWRRRDRAARQRDLHRPAGRVADAPGHRARELPAERVEEIARASGLKELSLETAEMAEGNVRLYRRHGFEIVRRGPPSHGRDAHVRVFMVKPL